MDSPIEALLFENLTVVNNLWTWIALATAAVSFWWIRVSSSASAVISISLQSRPFSTSTSPDDCIRSRSNNNNNNNNSPDVSSSSDSEPEPATTILSSPAPPSSPPSIFEDDVDRFTKGKFVVYFEDESDNTGEVECGSESEVTVAGEWPERFERVVERMRIGDLGWYRYQDLTAINGNVVRLWDGVSV